MRNVAMMVNARGGYAGLRADPLRIKNPPYMRLCVEATGTGPNGLPKVSVAHYYEQNGDLVCDPDMEFEVELDGDRLAEEPGRWHPVSIQHGTGLFQLACWRDAEGRVMTDRRAVADLRAFARVWDRNIKVQGFPGKV
jgi:hypothetical protein